MRKIYDRSIRMKKNLLIYFVVLANISCCFAQGNLSEINLKTEKIGGNYIANEHIPGLSPSISVNDSVIFSKGFGFANLENRLGVFPDKTKFRIASITKTMTATVLGKLSELGKIDLTRSPSFYLDSLQKKEYDFTIEEVGGHLAGLKRTASFEKYSCDILYKRADFFRIFDADNLLFEPSINMSYSNYGYKLLGVLAEKVTGTDIRANHKMYILDVLDLKNSVPETKDENEWRSTFYIETNGKITEAECLDCTFKYASGCYLSTSEDMVKLGNGYLFPNRILKKETLVELVKSKKLKNGLKTHYGFGFTNHTDSYGNQYYGHEGGYESARSCLRIYPKHKIVISVLVNRQVDDIDRLVSKVCNNYIKALE